MKTERFIDKAEIRLDSLTKLIDMLEKSIPSLPDGRIKIKHRGQQTYYYLLKPGMSTIELYMKQSDMPLVRNLIQRTYYERVLKVAREEQKLLKNLIAKYPPKTAEDIYEAESEDRRRFITPIRQTDEEYAREWLSQPFTTKGIPEDQPYFVTLKGEKVRSKSEQIIADRLYLNNIPYKYECPLVLDSGEILHPDFTILKMSDRTIKYLEHRGMMDDPEYAVREVKRTKKYARSGIYEGDQLFHLYETSVTPLDTETLDEFIRKHFV